MGKDSMRRLIVVIALLASCALPAFAQVSLAKFDSLAAVVAKMQRELGPYGDSVPPAIINATTCPELPNGRYSVMCRMQQIGLGIDANNLLVSGVQSQVAGALQRLAAVEGNGANNPTPGISNFVSGDLVVRGRICIVAPQLSSCDNDNQAQLQMIQNNTATIHFVSNLDGQQYQNPARHDGWVGLSSDGGLRQGINSKLSITTFTATDPSNGVTYQSSLREFLDPTREFAYSGFDSRGQLCWYIAKPGRGHDYTQDLCFRTYEDQKVLSLELWRPGWQFKVAESSGLISIDKWFKIPPQQ